MDITKHITLCWAASCLLWVTAAAVSAQQDPPARGSEAELIALLQSDAPLFDKAKACQQLATSGTRDCVPVLAKLLADNQLAHYARFGLESNPDPSVDAALRSALGTLEGQLLVGVINSIGARRDAAATDKLTALLDSTDAAVAAAAAAALGRIASPESVAILTAALNRSEPLRLAVADACLAAGDTWSRAGKTTEAAKLFAAVRQADLPRYLQLAALAEGIRTLGAEGTSLLVEQLQSGDAQQLAVGLSLAHRIPGEAVTRALIAELEKPYAQAAAESNVLVIVDARYGAADKWVDVTEALMRAITEDGLTIQAGNSLAGDPAPQAKKTLRVKYMQGRDTKEAVIPEGQSLALQGTLPQNSRHAQIIAVLEERGDKAALPAILQAAQQAPWDVRLRAIRALATLGDATSATLLLDTALADQGALSSAALGSLAELADNAVDQQIEARLAGSTGPAQRVLIELVGLREISTAVPKLFKLAGADDPLVSSAALDALGLTIQLEDLPRLVTMLVKAASDETAATARTALQKACQRMPDRDATSTILLEQMRDASPETRADLLDLLRVTGGDKALAGVAAAAHSDDDAVVDAATQVLGQWMTPDAAPVLLELAKSGDPKYRIRSLRGYIRIPRQLNVSPEEKLAMSAQALAIATRDQERSLVIKDVLANIPSPQALEMVMQHVDESGLQAVSCEAAVAIAVKIVKTDPRAVAAAMPKVVSTTQDRTVVGKARRLLRQMQQ